MSIRAQSETQTDLAEHIHLEKNVLFPRFERARGRARMCDFWSSVALMTGRYHGTPMAKHLPLPMTPNTSTVGSPSSRRRPGRCPPKAAGHFIERARRIAESLEIGIAGFNDSVLATGRRYRFLAVA